MENIYDIIAWGTVKVQDREFYLLAPKPYHSEMMDEKIVRSLWQLEGSLKWEVADVNRYSSTLTGQRDEDGDLIRARTYTRSLIVFGSDALIEFHQDPKTIKVKYIVPDVDDEN